MAQNYSDLLMPGEWMRPFIIGACSLGVILITVYCLSQGITIVFPHLYYLPIVLAAYWYRRAGVAFSAVLGVIYLLLVAALADPAALDAAGIRVIVFVAIAVVVAYLSERLVKGEKEYRTIFGSTGTAMLVVEEDMTISRVNTTMEELSGYSSGETEGKKKWTEFVAEDDLERMMEYHRLRRTDPASAPLHYEFGLINSEGRMRDVSLTIAMIPGTKKSVVSLEDITDLNLAEAAVRQKLEFEETLAAVTSRFTGIYDFDDAVSGALADMGRLSRADRAYLFLLREGGTVLDNTHEWCAEGVIPQIDTLQDLPSERTPWWMEKVRNRESIHITDVSKLPPEAEAERELLEMQEIRSLLVLPVFSGDEPAGFMGFDNVRETGEWSEEDILLLRTIAEIVGRSLELKRMQGALRESETRFREMVEHMPSGIAIYNAVDGGDDFVFVDFNRMGEEIESMAKAEVIGKRLTEAFPGAVDLGLVEVLRRVWKTGKSEYLPSGKLYKDERSPPTWRENWIYKLPTGEIVAIYNDISDRKTAEERLKKSENELNAIASSAKDAIIELDSEGRAQFWNEAAEAIFGYSKEEAIGENVHDLIAPTEYRESVKKGMDHFKKTGEGKVIGVTTEIEGLKKDGTTLPVELTVSSFILNGEWRAVAVVRDITDRKAAQRALEITNKKLQLLSGITRHDILNQITALAGYTDLLGEVLPDDPEMRKYIDRIMKATSAIERQISFTRDYEHLGVNPSLWQRVGDVAEQAAASGGCAAHGVSVITATGALEVFADPMLEKVFHNLFDNAVRHGEHVTEISITCREDDDGSMVIAVEDNGVGIPAELKERIFKHGFGRNTGYGLFLVQEILAITGMSIRETGEEGKGACFEITVPPGVWRVTESTE